jgi:hypothetical protein
MIISSCLVSNCYPVSDMRRFSCDYCCNWKKAFVTVLWVEQMAHILFVRLDIDVTGFH